MRATDLLAEDHQRVHQLFMKIEQTASGEQRQQLLDEIVDELEIHAQAEEEILYPAVAEVSRRVDDARAGHDHVRRLVDRVQGEDPSSQEFLTGARTLKSAVLAHVTEEEGAIFLEAGHLGAERLERLGREIRERKETLKTSLLQRGVRKIKQAARKIA